MMERFEILNSAGRQGYLFEPMMEYDSDINNINEDMTENIENNTSDSSDNEDIQASREGNCEWCTCKKCNHVLLVNNKEYVCCSEITKCHGKKWYKVTSHYSQ